MVRLQYSSGLWSHGGQCPPCRLCICAYTMADGFACSMYPCPLSEHKQTFFSTLSGGGPSPLSPPPGSATDAERGFSTMNIICTPLRNKLLVPRISNLLLANLTGPPLKSSPPMPYVKKKWLLKHRAACDNQSRKVKEAWVNFVMVTCYQFLCRRVNSKFL